MKTLQPDDRGAVRWARQYGDALVCVRHRTDSRGKLRHTTVELLVQTAPIQPRAVKMVYLQVAPHERALHRIVQAAGGRWDSRQRLWRLPSRIVGILSLRNRIAHPPGTR